MYLLQIFATALALSVTVLTQGYPGPQRVRAKTIPSNPGSYEWYAGGPNGEPDEIYPGEIAPS